MKLLYFLTSMLNFSVSALCLDRCLDDSDAITLVFLFINTACGIYNLVSSLKENSPSLKNKNNSNKQ